MESVGGQVAQEEEEEEEESQLLVGPWHQEV